MVEVRAPRAYIAGPITSSGSLHENIHNGIKVGEMSRDLGIHPFIPHLYDFTKIVTGKDIDWEKMLQMDENFIRVCDLIIALPGDSKGKEREIAFAKARGIPTIRLMSNDLEHNASEIMAWMYKFHQGNKETLWTP